MGWLLGMNNLTEGQQMAIDRSASTFKELSKSIPCEQAMEYAKQTYAHQVWMKNNPSLVNNDGTYKPLYQK